MLVALMMDEGGLQLRWHLEAGEGMEMDSPIELSEGKTVLLTP